MIRTALTKTLVALGLAAALLPAAGAAAAEALVVYSARNEQLIKPVFEAYTRETGVEIRFTTGDAAVLIERLAAEGRNSPADVLLTVDAGRSETVRALLGFGLYPLMQGHKDGDISLWLCKRMG